MTIREFSAGIVPFRSLRGERKYLILKSGLTMKELWEFPKGQIEEGENSLTTAVREFQEESGIQDCVMVPGFKKVLKYFYRRGKDLVAKTVTYYAAEVNTTRVKLSHESTDYEWVSLQEAPKYVRHKNILDLLREVDVFLTEHEINNE